MKKSVLICLSFLFLFALMSHIAHAANIAPFKAAVVQFNPALNERDKNLEGLAAAFEEAMQAGAKLIVAPEMSTTGYYYPGRAAIMPFVDTIPGKATDTFGKLTAKYGAYVVFGMPELDKKTGLIYNAAAMVGPKGVVGSYRKTHQWETEEHWSAYGDLGVPVYDTELGRIAINICMDSAYFETARLAGMGGADIMAFPTNSTSQALAALPARAIQNGIYIVSANRSNTENGFHMIGASAIWSPEGKCLVATPLTIKENVDATTIAYAEIDPAQYANANKALLKTRRPELYKDLMLRIAPWNYVKSTKPLKLSSLVVQFKPETNDADGNGKKIISFIDAELKANRGLKPDMIVLPEMALTGPTTSDSSAGAAFYAELAKKYKAYLVGSFVEKRGDDLYITAALFDRAGNEAGRYRKTHLNAEEKKWAKAGDVIGIFKTDIGRVGLMIGDEVRYPEISGLLAVLRADIIAIPSSWRNEDGGQWQLPADMSANRYPEGGMILWDAVAIGAQSYTLIANYVGGGYFGGSGLYTLDPLYGLDQPQFIAKGERAFAVKFRTIQPEWWFNQETLINSRREPYYKPLITE